MDELDLHPRIITAVKKVHLKEPGVMLSMSAPDLQRMTRLSAGDVMALQKAVAYSVPRLPAATALQLNRGDVCSRLQRTYLTTGCQTLDRFLRGGVLVQGVTEVAGESASGKTQLCLQLCLTVQLPVRMGGLAAGAVYICTEDAFPNKRLMQMVTLLKRRCQSADVARIDFTDNIFIEHVADVAELHRCVSQRLPSLLARGRVKLIVIDSVAALFRSNFAMEDAVRRAKQLTSLASQLHLLASRHTAAVICVNQVTDVFDRCPSSAMHRVTPCLGMSWANVITTRLLLTRTDRRLTLATQHDTTTSIDVVVRTMKVMFAPHLPNTVCRYIIDHEGFKVLS